MSITDEYFVGSSIDNSDTRAIMDFISLPESVNKMIIASEMGLPAITPIVKELEKRFENSKLSPLHHEGKNQNAVHRQNVGRMIKFVMAQFGYIPVDGGLSERARIPKFAESKHFSTAAIYAKKQNGKYQIKIKLV
jgi:hypothetical protein